MNLKPLTTDTAYLHLEDGSSFEGVAFGDWSQPAFGETVFNTSMVGYQEIFSDPSYAQQIVVLTYPLVGNYGVRALSMQSTRAWVNGVVLKEYFDQEDPVFENVHHLLVKFGVPGIQGIDTRALTRHIRHQGALRGYLSVDADPSAIGWESLQLKNHVAQVSTQTKYHIPGDGARIALIDFGVKKGILSQLIQRGCAIDVLPYTCTEKDLRDLNPDGVVLSNGPGDPRELAFQIPLIQFIQNHYPLMGICLGHQLFCMANGADTQKMKFGHRGGNQPVKDLQSGQCMITSQNHGFEVVFTPAAATQLKITHRNLNDGSIEGAAHCSRPAFSVQFHPEAQPGPQDSQYLFDQFISSVVRT